MPVATLFLVSFAQEGSWTTQTLPSAYTLANYQRLFGDPYAAEVFFNSLTMSAIAAVAALLWSFCVVTLLRRRRDERKLFGEGWRRLLSLLVLVPWALPGTVVAVSVAEAYGSPGSLLGSFVLVGTFWILPVVYFLRFHAARGARSPGKHGATRSDPRGGRGIAGRARVAEIYAGHAAARVAGRGCGDPAGICDRVRRICRFRACICSGESTHFDRDRIRVARLQSRGRGGIRCGFDRDHFDQHGRRRQVGTFARLIVYEIKTSSAINL